MSSRKCGRSGRNCHLQGRRQGAAGSRTRVPARSWAASAVVPKSHTGHKAINRDSSRCCCGSRPQSFAIGVPTAGATPMARRNFVRRNRMGGLDPLSKLAPMYAAEQTSSDPMTWKPIASIKSQRAEALVLLGRAEPVQVRGLPWILGYRYIRSGSAALPSNGALTAYSSFRRRLNSKQAPDDASGEVRS